MRQIAFLPLITTDKPANESDFSDSERQAFVQTFGTKVLTIRKKSWRDFLEIIGRIGTKVHAICTKSLRLALEIVKKMALKVETFF